MGSKTLDKVTKDPVRQEQGRKSHQTYMKRLKEQILEDNQLSTSSTGNSTPSASSSTCNSTPSSTSSYAVALNDLIMSLVWLLSLPLVPPVYFLRTKRRQDKYLFMKKKNKISHQNNFICFRI